MLEARDSLSQSVAGPVQHSLSCEIKLGQGTGHVYSTGCGEDEKNWRDGAGPETARPFGPKRGDFAQGRKMRVSTKAVRVGSRSRHQVETRD